MDFAVRVMGVHRDEPEGVGAWVLVVDGDRVLISHQDLTLHWHDLIDCTLVKVASPETPRPVVLVQPAPKPGFITPNRVLRRANNGHA